jgi:hypothetical protein
MRTRLPEQEQIDWSPASIDGSSAPSPGRPVDSHHSKMFEKCVDAIAAIAGLPGRARRRPARLQVDSSDAELT